MKVNTCVFSGVVAGCLFFSASAIARDLCESLGGMRLFVDGNGYEGATDPLGPLRIEKRQDGAFAFETTIQMAGEPFDKVVGKCKDRHIVFTRKREGSFEQVYDGWIFEKGGYKMAGTFSHNGQRKWGWCGSIKLAHQENSSNSRFGAVPIENRKLAEVPMRGADKDSTPQTYNNMVSKEALEQSGGELAVKGCFETAGYAGSDERFSELSSIPKSYVYAWLPHETFLDEERVKGMMKDAYSLAKNQCGKDTTLAEVCVRYIEDRNPSYIKCLAGGYVHESGEIERYSNEVVKEAEEKRKAAEAEEMRRLAEEQLTQNRRSPLLSFLKEAKVTVAAETARLTANPFVYEGKTVMVEAKFARMLSRNEAMFVNDRLEDEMFIVSGMPSTLLGESNRVLLAGVVRGIKNWKTPAGAEVALAHVEFVGAFEGEYEKGDIAWAIQSLGIHRKP